MKKNNYSRWLLLVLLSLVLIIFSFKDRVHSQTDTSDIPLESNPHSIAIHPITDIAVIANEKADSVSIVDLNTQAVLSTILAGKAPRGVAIDKGLNIAVVGNTKDDTATAIDLNTFSVVKTIPVGKEPKGMAIDSTAHKAYVTNHKDSTLSVIDLATLTAAGTIPVGQEPKDVAIDPELNLALVVNEKDYNVSVIDLNTHQVTGTVPVGQKPQAIDINPETHLAAVVNEKDNSITVINLNPPSPPFEKGGMGGFETSTIPVCKHPVDIAINQLDNRALVICDEDRSLLLIDLNTSAITKTYTLEKLPKGIAVNNLTNIAAITDDKTDSLTLIQLPNPTPEILAINPEAVLRGSSGETINIQGNKFIKTSSVTLLHATPYTLYAEFIDNHNLSVTIPKDLLLNAGTFQLTVTNPSPEGGTSNPINLQINNPIPSISMIDPIEVKAGTQSLILTIYGAGFFYDTEIYFNGIKKPITYISPSKLQINLTAEDLKTAGEYEITTRNLSPGGGFSNKAILTIKPSLEITITSPQDNTTINKSKTIVKGTFKSETKDVGIIVNGVIAEATGNEWIANNIPLSIGSNTITATIKDNEGNIETASITINTTDISQAVTLSANITSGIAPLQVFFSASAEIPNSITTYQMDFEGDGIVDYTAATFEDINHTYTAEGIFYPTITVTDNQGNTYSDTIAITVLSKTEIDTLLKEKWEGMKGELRNQDVEGAMGYFVERSKERYRGVFEALKDQLPTILETFIEFNIVDVFENTAEYEIVANENGVLYSYPGVIIKDANGMWKFKDF